MHSACPKGTLKHGQAACKYKISIDPICTASSTRNVHPSALVADYYFTYSSASMKRCITRYNTTLANKVTGKFTSHVIILYWYILRCSLLRNLLYKYWQKI